MTSMRVELLTIGSELLSGAIVNTNAAELAKHLAESGFPCRRQTAVPDEWPALLEVMRQAIGRSDVVVITGGLGPTFDDLTMAAIAEVTGRPLVFWPRVAATVRRFYRRHHRALQQAALRQAKLPRGGVPIPNPLGTAPGLWLALPRAIVIALPGVPAEMRAMLARTVLPRLKRLRGATPVVSRTLRTIGLVELSIEAILRRLTIPPGVEVGLYPSLRMVDVRLTATGSSRAQAARAVARLERPLRRRLSTAVYGMDGETLEGAIGRLLLARRATLAVAESCTGGLVSDRITSVAGSSQYLRGAVVAYHNDLKTGALGVSSATLARTGAVSAPVAGQMARGVRRLAKAGYGLAITGIAGPTGGTKTKPVGLVYLALADGRRTLTRRCRFFGDRLAIKTQAAQTALDLLRRKLLSMAPSSP